MENDWIDFFILGAPKSGTSSLADWLGQHERVFIPSIKEPNFYNTDANIPNRISSGRYRKLFDRDKEGVLKVGEATTGYLRSSEAVDNILEEHPK